MAEIRVPRYNRPSIWKYVVYTAIGFVLVGTFSGLVVRNADGGLLGVGVLVVAALANLGILFLMVQSLIEEWFDAAEVFDE